VQNPCHAAGGLRRAKEEQERCFWRWLRSCGTANLAINRQLSESSAGKLGILEGTYSSFSVCSAAKQVGVIALTALFAVSAITYDYKRPAAFRIEFVNKIIPPGVLE